MLSVSLLRYTDISFWMRNPVRVVRILPVECDSCFRTVVQAGRQRCLVISEAASDKAHAICRAEVQRIRSLCYAEYLLLQANNSCNCFVEGGFHFLGRVCMVESCGIATLGQIGHVEASNMPGKQTLVQKQPEVKRRYTLGISSAIDICIGSVAHLIDDRPLDLGEVAHGSIVHESVPSEHEWVIVNVCDGRS